LDDDISILNGSRRTRPPVYFNLCRFLGLNRSHDKISDGWYHFK